MQRRPPCTPALAPTSVVPGVWPFPASRRGTSPGIQRAALNVLRTTARDWGLASSR